MKAKDIEWRVNTKNLLKSELKRRGISYAQLAAKLGAIGIHDSEANIANKICRGGFTAVFLLQVMEAMAQRSLV